MPGKPRKAPDGYVTPITMVGMTGHRLTLAAFQRMHKEGRHKECLGLKESDVRREGRFLFIRREAAERLARDAGTHTVHLTPLMRGLGMGQPALHKRLRTRRKFGRGWYTTEAEKDRLLEQGGIEQSSHSTTDVARIMSINKATALKWFRTGKLPSTRGHPDRVPAWWLERHREGYVYNPKTRHWDFPGVVKNRKERWSVAPTLGKMDPRMGAKPPGRPPEEKPPPGRLELIKERHRRLIEDGQIDQTAWLEED